MCHEQKIPLALIFLTVAMVNILVWNIRGLANKPSLTRLRKLMKLHNIEVLAILEPKVTKGTIEDYEFKLNCVGSFSNREGNIWLFWKNSVKVVVHNFSAQFIFAMIDIGGVKSDVFFI